LEPFDLGVLFDQQGIEALYGFGQGLKGRD
jgi:hypothetical protein